VNWCEDLHAPLDIPLAEAEDCSASGPGICQPGCVCELCSGPDCQTQTSALSWLLHYGLLGNRARGSKLARCRQLLEALNWLRVSPGRQV